jgi:hypothetical protein
MKKEGFFKEMKRGGTSSLPPLLFQFPAYDKGSGTGATLSTAEIFTTEKTGLSGEVIDNPDSRAKPAARTHSTFQFIFFELSSLVARGIR